MKQLLKKYDRELIGGVLAIIAAAIAALISVKCSKTTTDSDATKTQNLVIISNDTSPQITNKNKGDVKTEIINGDKIGTQYNHYANPKKHVKPKGDPTSITDKKHTVYGNNNGINGDVTNNVTINKIDRLSDQQLFELYEHVELNRERKNIPKKIDICSTEYTDIPLVTTQLIALFKDKGYHVENSTTFLSDDKNPVKDLEVEFHDNIGLIKIFVGASSGSKFVVKSNVSPIK